MFSIRNVEKYLKDHPEVNMDIETIKSFFNNLPGGTLDIPNAWAYTIFGTRKGLEFLREVETNSAHITIALEDAARDEARKTRF